MKKIDMSEEAVWRRLRQVDQLHELCLSLMKARILTDEESKELRKKNREDRERAKERSAKGPVPSVS